MLENIKNQISDSKCKNIVVGAGLSGAIIANRIAHEKNEDVIILERRDHIGGNCYDYKEHNISVHKYGPHVFHTSYEEVWSFLSQYTKWEPFFYNVKAYIDGNLVTIPFNLNSLYESFPESLALKYEKSLLEHFSYGDKATISDLCANNDPILYELALFIKNKIFDGYSFKQWGKDVSSLPISVSNRVPILISRDNRYFQDKYSAIPQSGYTAMVRNLIANDKIKCFLNVGNINLNTINEIGALDENINIYYSGSIDEFFDYKFGILPYRTLDIRFQEYDFEFYQSTAQINYPNDYDFTRTVEYKHYLREKSNVTIVSREYPMDFDLQSFAQNQLLDRYYPIDDKENIDLFNKYVDYAQSYKQLHFIGRLGIYKYLNMDQCVFNALNYKID